MRPVDIFIAYSHNDLAHKNELKKFLRPLLNTGMARLWDDHEIEGGQDWEAEIKKRLYGADIILLLVSPDSLASEYFYGQEVKVSLERHDKGEASVIPVILRPCAWTITPLKRLEALPEKARPVTSWPSQDEAYTDIAHKIGSIVESRQEVLATASQQEERQRDFEAAAEAAEHLFHKKQWVEAQKAFASALVWHQPGFVPDQRTLEDRMDACAAALKQEKDAAEKQTRRKEYESLLAAVDYTVDPKQQAQMLQKAMQQYEPGFPGSVEDLRQRLHAAQTYRQNTPVSEPDTPREKASVNVKLIVLAAMTIVLLVLGVNFLRSAGNNKPRENKEPANMQQPEKPATEHLDWKSDKTIPGLKDWLDKNPNADAQERAAANTHLQSLLKKRENDLKDARVYLKAKDYPEVEKIIDTILRENPKDEEARRLRGLIPKY